MESYKNIDSLVINVSRDYKILKTYRVIAVGWLILTSNELRLT